MQRNSSSRSNLDSLDRKILAELQRDNRQSMSAIGSAIGLSEPAVRRRVKRLRDKKIITADVSLIDPALTTLTIILSVRLEKESRSTYERLKALVASTPEIAQCYTVTGEEDFILIGHFTDMAAYDTWINQRILTETAIARTTTNVVYQRVKFETAIDV